MGKRIIAQRRGSGSKRYTSPSFNFKSKLSYPKLNEKINGIVKDIFRCRGHTAPLIELELDNGVKKSFLAGNKAHVKQKIELNSETPDKGNVCMLKYIPEGSNIYNIEINPGDGGKLVRTGGTFGILITKLQNKVIVLLPSKKKKTLNWDCRATVGTIAGSGRVDKPLLKAGNKYKKFRSRNKVYPVVSAGSMNAVDHPFGNSRSLRKTNNKPAPKNAPPGRNVGTIHPKRQGRKKGKR